MSRSAARLGANFSGRKGGGDFQFLVRSDGGSDICVVARGSLFVGGCRGQRERVGGRGGGRAGERATQVWGAQQVKRVCFGWCVLQLVGVWTDMLRLRGLKRK